MPLNANGFSTFSWLAPDVLFNAFIFVKGLKDPAGAAAARGRRERTSKILVFNVRHLSLKVGMLQGSRCNNKRERKRSRDNPGTYM